MHIELRARHSLSMHFATFAGSDYEALEPIVELEQAKRAMKMVTDVADRLEARMRERGWCLWAIGGWKAGWCHQCRRDHCGAYWHDTPEPRTFVMTMCLLRTTVFEIYALHFV
jgi:hypothetical protein